jgi:hypothetical protein
MVFPYACAECGAEVHVEKDGKVTRTCDHADATVIAERTSNLFGEGGAAGNTGSLSDRVAAALTKLVNAFKK